MQEPIKARPVIVEGQTHVDPHTVTTEYGPGGYGAIMSSGQEGVKFPAAMSEVFRRAQFYVTIKYECINKSSIFPGTNEDEKMLMTTIRPSKELFLRRANVQAEQTLTRYTNLSDLSAPLSPPSPGFNPIATAKDFLQAFKQYYGIQE